MKGASSGKNGRQHALQILVATQSKPFFDVRLIYLNANYRFVCLVRKDQICTGVQNLDEGEYRSFPVPPYAGSRGTGEKASLGCGLRR